MINGAYAAEANVRVRVRRREVQVQAEQSSARTVAPTTAAHSGTTASGFPDGFGSSNYLTESIRVVILVLRDIRGIAG